MGFLGNGKAVRRQRGRLLTVFLGLSLVLAVGLAYQAVDAARSHREAAESVLRDYARVAAWEFSRRAEGGLSGAAWPAFEPLRRIRPPAPGAPIPSPAVLASAQTDDSCGCGTLGPAEYFFRLDLSDGELTVVPDPLERAQADRLTGVLTAEASRDGAALSGHPRILADGRRTGADVVIWSALRDRAGAIRAVYGLAAGARALRPVFERLCSEEPLLPPSIARGQANDSLLYITVVTPGGATLYESPARYPALFAADDTLSERLGGVITRAAVRPQAADQLVIGGLPRTRLPLILGLLMLAGGVGTASLVQIRRERELARLRDDFISGVSHELRTPLTQIRMFAELLDDGTLRSEAERRRSTRILRRESHRLSHLIENVLSFSRARRLTERLAPQRVDLDDLIAETVESFRPLADARDVRLEARTTAATAFADPALLRQMLINLLDNAVKYGPPGQTVTLWTERTDGRVRIRVSDQGPGVPVADRERIWEAYHRLARDANGPVGGSGIGLALVRELALRHGGGVRVEDAPGGGATFILEIPAEPLPRSAVVAETAG